MKGNRMRVEARHARSETRDRLTHTRLRVCIHFDFGKISSKLQHTGVHMTRYLIAALLLCTGLASVQKSPEYKLLATSRTSTMEKEINEAAREGYRFAGTMGGDTHEGEIITIMRKLPDGDDKDRFQYKLLATERTGTMQREMQEA